MTGLSRKIFMGICICVMAVSALSVSRQCEAAAKRSGDYTYIETSKGVTITKYSGKIKKVKIPKKINGKKVTAIDYLAFKGNKKMVEVTVPNTVEKIGSGAFRGCKNLRKVKLSKNIKKLEDGTFVNCRSLKRVVMPERLKKIERACFKYCEKLEKIDLSNVEEIDRIAFEGNVSLKGTLDLSGAEKVWNEAFKGCTGIEKVIFSEELELLGDGFYYANSDNSVQGEYSFTPFVYCEGITAFEIAPTNVNYKTVDGVIYGKSGEWLVAYPAAKTGVFTVPETVKGIADYAFASAKASEVILGNNVTVLGKKAFEKSMITTIKFPKLSDSVTLNVGSGCFNYCSELVNVRFAENAASGNGITFKYCSKLSEVYLPETMTELADSMFMGCTSLKKITIPQKVTSLPKDIFSGCTSLTDINLDNITVIGSRAFENCKSLGGTLTLNADTINDDAFADCTGITAVVFNKPLIKIGYKHSYDKYNNAFAGCTDIESFTTAAEGSFKSYDGILYTSDMKTLVAYPAKRTGTAIVPYGVEKVAGYAFAGSNAAEIRLSESVSRLGEYAISDSKVKKIEISSSLESVEPKGVNIFTNCPELEEISVDEDNPYYESDDGVLYGKNIDIYSATDEEEALLLVYPPSKRDKKYTVKKCDAVAEYAFADNKYLKKLYFESDKTCLNGALFTNGKNVSVYLPKKMAIYPSAGYDKDNKYLNLYVFSNDCSKCKVYVKKGAKHDKLLREKNNDSFVVKYYR